MCSLVAICRREIEMQIVCVAADVVRLQHHPKNDSTPTRGFPALAAVRLGSRG